MKMDVKTRGFQFAIDRGGTFTDIYARCPNGKVRVMKLLSVDPQNYADAPTEGIRRIIEQEINEKISCSQDIDISKIEWIRMGTTVATNALLERKGERMALLITAGFRDLLFIGNQARPKIFDLEIVCPEILYEEVIEVEERIVIKQEKCELNTKSPVTVGITGEEIEIWTPVNTDTEKLKHDLQQVLNHGIKSLAVVLAHSYTFQGHEITVGELAQALGFEHVSLSSQVMPMVRMVPRGYTACADAYLTPCIKKYIESFTSGFKNNLKGINVLFMQSDGGLTPMNKFCGSRAILSGPAGGVVGYAMTTYNEEKKPVIGFDMGGTSTDVSRYDGHYEHVFESTTAGVTIQAPQLDINTVAAGGGSMLFFRSGMFVVGPESAGAHPGPVCYRKGGPLTVTDANLCLGRLLPEYFPKIFGKTEDQPLDKNGTIEAFKELTSKINSFLENQSNKSHSKHMSVEEVAMGFINVANEAMCRPIRALTQGKGYDTSQHILACFGGAGGQHACSIARSLGMSSVFIHRYAGILSAYGMALADVVHEAQEPCALVYCLDSYKIISQRIDNLVNQCKYELKKQGFSESFIKTEPFLHMRYERTDCALMCSAINYPANNIFKYGDFKASFIENYKREFGFIIPDRPIIVDDIRVRGIGQTHINVNKNIPKSIESPKIEMMAKCYFEDNYHDTPVYLLENLSYGHCLKGPCIIIEKNCTILVEPDCEANITEKGDVKIKILSNKIRKIGTELDSIQLSIFSHRFMSIAEQMGRILQRTSISTNIKERLDFSCALFGPDGGLVSNAPHIPVHLGAMQEAVQFQIKYLDGKINQGDVLLTNHPCAGGSHLPDLTVITPVFYEGQPKPIFFVASRGHHADIGGITPGSMPPHSTSLSQEGAAFISFKLIKDGLFQEKALTDMLMAPGKISGSSGSRNLNDNISDLRAQVAANQKGIMLVTELINSYGLDVIQAYMNHIQNNAEIAVCNMLKEIGNKVSASNNFVSLFAEDSMDDGTIIKLQIQIDKKQGTAIFNFNDTGYEVYGNCNAPKAVTLSAIIYCLRCMVGYDVPLNQGCLAPVKVIIPKGSILSPSEDAAVVGGNVLTSQRIVDVVLKAFKTCSASQGCMNNITFGDKEIGYYETVAGGAGAGPYWHGRSGVHTHMTNTRMTDPEIVERRYPVIVRCFHLNPDTGGKGQFCGGDGIVRELLFRKELILSVLTERRVFAPYGMEGGEDGKRGLNLLIDRTGRVINLGSKTSVIVKAGDIFHLETPGGGGYGKPGEIVNHSVQKLTTTRHFEERGSVHEYRRLQETA